MLPNKTDNTATLLIVSVCLQRVQVIRSSVRAMGCVFLRVNCVMDTHNAATTAMKPTVLASIVCTSIYCLYFTVIILLLL